MEDPTTDLLRILPKATGGAAVNVHALPHGHRALQNQLSASTIDTNDESDGSHHNASLLAHERVVFSAVPVTSFDSARLSYKRPGSMAATLTVTSAAKMASAIVSQNPHAIPNASVKNAGRSSAAFGGADLKSSQPQASGTTVPMCSSALSAIHTLTTSSKPTAVVSSAPSSGAVRRLFGSPAHANSLQLNCQPLNATVVVTATQTVPYPPKLPLSEGMRKPVSYAPSSSTAGLRTTHVRQVHAEAINPAAFRTAAGPSNKNTEIARKFENDTMVSQSSTIAMSAIHDLHKKKNPKVSLVTTSGNMSYSKAISSVSTVEVHQHDSAVIEQPLQQIMKTPTILQEPASQIAKLKKKSTYSDAVGKKFASAAESVSVKAAPPVQAAPAAYQPSKLSLAPGARPQAGESRDKVRLSLCSSVAIAGFVQDLQ